MLAVQNVMNVVCGWLSGHSTIVVTILLALEQVLAQVTQVEANSYYQLVKKGVNWLIEKLVGKDPAAK